MTLYGAIIYTRTLAWGGAAPATVSAWSLVSLALPDVVLDVSFAKSNNIFLIFLGSLLEISIQNN